MLVDGDRRPLTKSHGKRCKPPPSSENQEMPFQSLRGHFRPDRAAAIMICVAVVFMPLAAIVWVGPAVAEPAASADAVKEVRETLDAAEKLVGDGKPGKAAARVADAAKAIEALVGV